MKTKSSIKEIITVNLIIFMSLVMLYLFTIDTRLTTVLSPSNGAIYRGNEEKPNVSLMFNVYWGTEHIDGILNVLEEEGVHATFFIGGIWANSQPKVLRQIADKGHELGNHGYIHKNHTLLSKEENIKEIKKAEAVIEEITGVKTMLFAPPSGVVNARVLTSAAEAGYKTIMWTADTIDWRDHEPELIRKRAIEGGKNGSLILMHPTAETLQALPGIIKGLKEAGFNIVTVTENIQPD
ncbi:MAG TPA: polysaccharide deacetylase family protein [Clostridia bacterium]|nr:polysaccharide deacetylase family protein [Clostridia bacterium]